jgi:phasin family protein
MYPFPQSVNPAVRSHFDAQIAFFNDLSRSLTRSFQDVCQLNIQLGQTMLEETTIASQRLMTTDRPNDALTAAASRVQPASDKLRAYQQHLSGLAASTQVDLARVTEQHVQETTRTARALADEVSRAASEETDRNMRQQEEALKNFRDPFKGDGTRGAKTSMQAPGNLQSTGNGASGSVQVEGKAGNASFQGSVQGAPSAQPAQQAGNKTIGKPT